MRNFILFCVLFLSAAIATAQPMPSFYLGADISPLTQTEQRGGLFLDNGKPEDALKVFMKRGWTCFRLRIWVNPNPGRGGRGPTSGPAGQGLEYTTSLARRIKDAGGQFMLDFHYSDWWADPQKQNKPAAWAKLDFDGLEKQVETYSADVIRHLKEAGACPDFVQIGNEITGGMLWPDGQVKVLMSTIKVFTGDVQPIAPPEPYDDAKQWDHLIRLIKAGSRGVRGATTPADKVRIIIHIDCGGDWPVTRWYFDHLTESKVDYDIIGQSYYPNYHGTLENLRDNLRETVGRYHKDVMVVEAAYPSTTGRAGPGDQNMVWPKTPDGQKQFIADVIRTVKEAPEHRGIGVIYWIGGFFGGGTALFDQQGIPKPVLDLLPGQ